MKKNDNKACKAMNEQQKIERTMKNERTERLGMGAIAAVLVLASAGCKKDEVAPSTDTGGGAQQVTTEARMAFDLLRGDQPFTLGDVVVDGDGRSVRITKLRFFVSGAKAVDDASAQVGSWPSTYLLVNAAQSNEFVLGDIHAEHVHRIGFDLGVDSATNHGDMTQFTEPPLNDPTATWMWNQDFGYKFIDLSAEFDADGNGTVDPGEGAFDVHAAGDDLLTAVQVQVHGDLQAGQPFVVRLKVDLAGLFANVTVQGATHSDLQGTTPRTAQIMANLAAGISAAD